MAVIIHTRFYGFLSLIIYKFLYVNEFFGCLHLSVVVIRSTIVC